MTFSISQPQSGMNGCSYGSSFNNDPNGGITNNVGGRNNTVNNFQGPVTINVNPGGNGNGNSCGNNLGTSFNNGNSNGCGCASQGGCQSQDQGWNGDQSQGQGGMQQIMNLLNQLVQAMSGGQQQGGSGGYDDSYGQAVY